MERKEIEKRTLRVFKEQLGFVASALKMTDVIRDDLGADSLDEIEIVMAIEEEFEMEISDTDAEKITTVGEAVDYLEQRMTPNAGVTERGAAKPEETKAD